MIDYEQGRRLVQQYEAPEFLPMIMGVSCDPQTGAMSVDVSQIAEIHRAASEQRERRAAEQLAAAGGLVICPVGEPARRPGLLQRLFGRLT